MNFKDLDIKDFLEQHGAHFVTRGGREFSKCIFHQEKSESLTLGQNRAKCYGCGFEGDIIDAYKLLYNASYKEAKRALEGEVPPSGASSYRPRIIKPINKQDIEREAREKKEKTERRLKAILSNSQELPEDGLKYLESRGLGKLYERLKRGAYNIPLEVKYNNYKGDKKLIYNFKGYKFLIEKRLEPSKERPKAQNTGAAQAVPLIINKNNNNIAIVEGIEDALSLILTGYNVITLNGVSNVKSLLTRLGASPWGKDKRFIILTDTDDAGRRASQELEQGLANLGLSYEVPEELIKYFKSKGYKDYNDYYKIKNKGVK